MEYAENDADTMKLKLTSVETKESAAFPHNQPPLLML